MKNLQKGSISIILTIILLLVAVYAIYYYSHGNLLGQRIGNVQQTQTQKQPPPPPQIITKKIGESFVLWNIEYKVVSAKNFVPTYDFQKTTGKYIGVKINVTNVGKVGAGVNKVYIQDDKGRQYQSTILGYQQLDVADYGQDGVIQPGISKTYGVIFEVAKDAKGLKLEYPSAEGQVVATVSLGL